MLPATTLKNSFITLVIITSEKGKQETKTETKTSTLINTDATKCSVSTGQNTQFQSQGIAQAVPQNSTDSISSLIISR